MAAIRQSISVGVLLFGSFAALVLASNSCGSGFTWEGTWSGKRNMPLKPGTPTYLANSLQRVTLTLKSNGEYELNASGVPHRGMYHISGKEGTLEQVTLLDRPTEPVPPVVMKANKDGTITLSSPDSFDSNAIILHRESQPTGSNVRT